MKNEFRRNDEIEVKILETKPKEKKILLGRKQLTENPYQTYIEKHGKGDSVKGKVIKITDFGAFVKLDNNVDGMIPKSHISRKKIENVKDVLKEGDEVNCTILDYDLKNNKITLSIKNYEKKQERMEIEKYTVEENNKEDKVTLGELIDLDKLKKQEEE